MNRRAQHARSMLSSIAAKLAAGPVVKLNDSEHDYLLGVCRAALDGTADPLGIGKAAGGQSLADGLGEAQQVHRRVKAGDTIRAACEAVGLALHRDGSKSGAVEKNFKQHRTALDAADRFYAARRAGTVPDDADIEAIVAPKGRGK